MPAAQPMDSSAQPERHEVAAATTSARCIAAIASTNTRSLLRHWQPDATTLGWLHAADLRLTTQRRAMLAALQACAEQFTDATALRAALMRSGLDVMLATVGEFERAKIVQVAHVRSKALYCLVGACGVQPQFVCTRCGYTAPLIDPAVQARLAELAGVQGYLLESGFALAGTCPSCRVRARLWE